MTPDAYTDARGPILTVNSGSTSVKLALIGDGDDLLGGRDLGALPASADELAGALAELGADAVAVAHRIVHGGPRTAPTLVDADVVAELRAHASAAPLHAAPGLQALDAAQAAIDRPQVVCFDTAFHATLPDEAATYAIPRAWREKYGLRRYGFHGLSHAHAARRAAEVLPRTSRLVTCHLGGGASLAAVLDGRSVDTTMGFTPLEGLVMNTRSGDVDPGLLLWLARTGGIGLDELDHALEHLSGLRGLADRDATLAELYAADDEQAALAVRVYAHRLAGGIARMTAALGGLDALVFTGGVGEHVPMLRHDVAERLGYLGVRIDPVSNSSCDADAVISPEGAELGVLVVHAREDLALARAARTLIG